MLKIFSFFCLITLINAAEVINPNFVNKNVERKIDLNSQLVKITGIITIENTGEQGHRNYFIAFEKDLKGSISYFRVQESQSYPLNFTRVTVEGADPNQIYYKVDLKQNVEYRKTTTIIYDLILTKALVPYPSSITQKEKQLVRYFGNPYFYSPYVTKNQKTTVQVSSRTVENYTKLKPVSQTESTINYGPYENTAAFTQDVFIVHYENSAPFLTVTKLVRSIEVSHWGNIAIEENIEIKHTGAKLKGSFSRYDYQREIGPTHHSVKSYKTILPAQAHNIYYRDMNGNISTSAIRNRKEYIELELRPRFPLFGGWQSSYTLGYSVPSYGYLFNKPSGEFVLNIRLLDHIFYDMYVEELETNIVLPVGTSNVKFNAPYEVKRLPDGVEYKYLDYLGRTVIRCTKNNLVEQHIQDIEITYDWNVQMLLHEPISVAFALFLIFLVVIIYVRLDFSIKKPEHSKKE